MEVYALYSQWSDATRDLNMAASTVDRKRVGYARFKAEVESQRSEAATWKQYWTPLCERMTGKRFVPLRTRMLQFILQSLRAPR
jgi:hypothetical protein